MSLVSPVPVHTQQPGGEIRVGAIQSLRGEYAGYGEGALFGLEAAVSDINDKGGVTVGTDRMPIKLVVEDSRSNPDRTGNLAESLISRDKVQFIISGDEPSQMHYGVSTVCDRYKIPYVTSVGLLEPWLGMRQKAATGWEYTWATGMFAMTIPAQTLDFRSGNPNYTVLDTWMDMLKKYSSRINKNVAMFASDDAEGRSWYNTLGPLLKKMGYTPFGWDIKMGLTPSNIKDFSTAINYWKTNNCEVFLGNATPSLFQSFWEQCQAQDFEPKLVGVGRAPLFYQDIVSWGDDLPEGVGVEVGWDPSFKNSPGIGSTTPASLAERWARETGQPLNRNIGSGYRSVQVLVDALQRAGTLNSEKVNHALADTDLMTIGHRVKFDENHFSRSPVIICQWFKTGGARGWEQRVVFSRHNFAPVRSQPFLPVLYD